MANKKRNSQKTITRTYHSRIKGMLKGEVEREIFDALSAGKNTYLRYDRLQSSSFDSSWIEMIEGVIFDLGEIIANPRMNTKVEGNIVPVELARKTGAESVQHLSSHTQYIKEIDEYGNVIPSKIMTMVNEDDLHTYENRFIATFVRRLVLFIEKRYEVVSEFAELKNQEVLMFKNKSIVNGAEVEIETKVKVAYKADDENAVKSSDYIKRIQEIRNYVLYFYNSSFMRQLKTERDVRNPILQTNIIRKNPKYHHCYEVYKFIETYDKLGVNYKVDENYSLFSEEEMNELNHTLFANYVTLRGKDISKNHKEIKHVYKPRILTSMDDEQFIYGKYINGPISFVRVDERYQEYLDSKIRKDLPLHPTKREKEYYADEYEEKRQNKEDRKEKDDLLKRKGKENHLFEKDVQKILQEREAARLAWAKMEQDLIKKEENERLSAARAALIAASLSDQEQAEREYQEKDEAQKLEELKARIAETEVVPMSHPEQEPVTYDEAVEDIWPQTKDAPALRVPSEDETAEPVKDVQAAIMAAHEEPEQEAQPVITPVEMSHPYSEPVTYEQAVEQIWPQTKGVSVMPIKQEAVVTISKEQPVANEVPTQEEVIEQPVVETAPVKEAQPVVTPVPMSHPIQEPVTYDEAIAQIWPNIVNAPALRVVPEEEQVQEKQEPVPPVSELKEKEPVVVVVPMSHPAQEPVTYDEAVAQIWPNIKDAPVLRVAPKEEPVSQVAKEQPAEETINKENKDIVPAITPVEMSHPYQEPVSYDEAVEQIWPQTKGVNVMPIRQEVAKEEVQPIVEEKTPRKVSKPKAKKAPVQEQPVVENAPREYAPEDIKPAVVPVEMSHPAQEPVTYDEAVEQIWPQTKDAPALRVAPEEETSTLVEEPAKAPKARSKRVKKAKEAETPLEEENAPQKAVKTKKGAKKAAKEDKSQVEQPVIEEKPVEEAKVEEPVQEEIKEPAPVEEKPVEQPVAAPKQAPKKKKPVVAPVLKKPNKPAPKKQAPKPQPKKQPEQREKIPGKFIVKTNEGYYVAKNKYSIYKHEAKIFDDFNLANDIKKNYGGKVVKL